MKMDLSYIDNWSLWLDLKIFFKTAQAVLVGAGR
jgi:lipopolysaccharide/colanic/teichoic acid biosynthesis glycosyltransferase